jgi:hypothetical protein
LSFLKINAPLSSGAAAAAAVASGADAPEEATL